MYNTKHDDTSKELELFLSDEYEKVFSFPKPKKHSTQFNVHDKYHDEVVQNKRHLRERKQNHFKSQKEQESSGQVKIEEDHFDDQSSSQFGFSQSIHESDSSSRSILMIDSDSMAIEGKDQKIEKEGIQRFQRVKKTKKIKRLNKGKKQRKSKNKKQSQGRRKIRTTVSQEKIEILEHLFPYIEKKLAYKGTIINLKDVAKIVNLGYSTILHKYKDYRRKGNVQKGLLLKSKDVKRKYNKSLVIETHIKQALKQRKFNTAKQLAIYLSEKHKLNLNRSIVSRHLNEMKREKNCDYIGNNINDDLQSKSIHSRENQESLKQFSRIFMGLKSEKFEFLYMTVIRIYLVEGKLVKQLKNETNPTYIINLVVTATESQLLFYYPTSPTLSQPIIVRRYSHKHKYSAFQTLYDQLLEKIDQKRMQVQNSSEVVYIVFPYQDKNKEFHYRQKVMKRLVEEKINVLVIPPRFNQQNTNFVHKWFFKKVYRKIENKHFEDFSTCKQLLMKTMNEEQTYLWDYASEMISVIRKAQ